MSSSKSNIPNLLFMVRPMNFGFNEDTANSNSFQNRVEITEVALKARQEFDLMTTKLKANEIELVVYDDVRNDLPDSVFCNNWIAQIPNQQLAIFPMCSSVRQNEIRQDVIDDLSKKMNLPVADIRSMAKQNQFLESTGSIVFHHDSKTAFACISNRTNIELFEAFCSQINYKSISFKAVDLRGDDIYHTNVVMSIAANFVLICLECIEDILERQLVKNAIQKLNIDLIEISYQQMNSFLGNCFEVINQNNEKFLLMSSTADKSLNRDQRNVIECYNKILAFEIPTIETLGGGSVRCMIAGLFT